MRGKRRAKRKSTQLCEEAAQKADQHLQIKHEPDEHQNDDQTSAAIAATSDITDVVSNIKPDPDADQSEDPTDAASFSACAINLKDEESSAILPDAAVEMKYCELNQPLAASELDESGGAFLSSPSSTPLRVSKVEHSPEDSDSLGVDRRFADICADTGGDDMEDAGGAGSSVKSDDTMENSNCEGNISVQMTDEPRNAHTGSKMVVCETNQAQKTHGRNGSEVASPDISFSSGLGAPGDSRGWDGSVSSGAKLCPSDASSSASKSDDPDVEGGKAGGSHQESAGDISSRGRRKKHDGTGENKWRCDVCGDSFKKKWLLNRHSQKHTGKWSFTCDVCGKGFFFKRYLDAHFRLHTGEKPFKCSDCGAAFRLRSSLSVHRSVHASQRLFKCNVCGKAFRGKADLRTHRATHSDNKKHHCDQCGASYVYKSSLIVHVRSAHTAETPYHCDKCEQSFFSNQCLKKHVVRVHDNVRPFICDECGKGFCLQWELIVHKRTHTGEKPFICDVCDRSYASKKTLTAHRCMHLHTEEKPYTCRICQASFAHKHKLRNHSRVHSNEKPYTCQDCGRSFRYWSSLAKHRKFHALLLADDDSDC